MRGKWAGLGSGLHATLGRQFVIVTCGLGGRLGPPFRLALRVGELLGGKRLTSPILTALMPVSRMDHESMTGVGVTCELVRGARLIGKRRLPRIEGTMNATSLRT